MTLKGQHNGVFHPKECFPCQKCQHPGTLHQENQSVRKMNGLISCGVMCVYSEKVNRNTWKNKLPKRNSPNARFCQTFHLVIFYHPFFTCLSLNGCQLFKESCRIAVAIFLLHWTPVEGARVQPVSYIYAGHFTLSCPPASSSCQPRIKGLRFKWLGLLALHFVQNKSQQWALLIMRSHLK